MLYFFRTPPGIRVGRAPIDEDAIRLLEEHNPDVQFDWTRILKQPQPQPQEQGRREDRRDRHRPASSSQLPASRSHLPASGFQLPASEGSEVDESVEAVVEFEKAVQHDEPVAPPTEPEPIEPEPLEPEPLGAGSWQPEAGSWQPEAGGGQPDADIPARYARLGPEGLARLRARYAEVMARIREKPLDEAAKDELRAKAEPLNPDAWVTEDEVTAALEQYETVFEAIRPLVGRQPRRRRRRRV